MNHPQTQLNRWPVKMERKIEAIGARQSKAAATSTKEAKKTDPSSATRDSSAQRHKSESKLERTRAKWSKFAEKPEQIDLP